MARMRSITSIDARIDDVKSELLKIQKKQDSLTAELMKLQKQKQDYESRQVMDAFKKSGKSLDELLTFLDV